MKNKVSIFDVAKYFIWFGKEVGDPVTHLKLQKLCYYAEAMYLAIYGERLTGENFQAWPHGPVSKKLYDKYKDYRWRVITTSVVKPRFSAKVEEHLDDIAKGFFKYSAYQLEL